jgi:DNA-binding NarL/FixJ family response regulator
MTALGDLATSALAHDAAGALAGIEAYVATHGNSPEVDAVRAFVHVLNCEFDQASAWLPTDAQPLTSAVAGFVAAVCLAQVPPVHNAPDPHSGSAGLHTFVTVEAAMSAGQIAQADIYAHALRPHLFNLDGGTYWAWNQVALARSLAFQGRFTDARAEIDLVLSDPRRDAWPAVDRIARGSLAFIAAHEGDPEPGGRYAAELLAELPDPRTYMESAAFVLAAFAEQAAGRAAGTDELILHGGGGDYLPRFQIVDRVYCYEILIESALDRDCLDEAQRWLQLAEVLPTDAHDMAGAAVARCRARVALALDDPATGARQSELSGQRAAVVGGSLEVFRSELLKAAASRAQGEPVDSESLEQVVRLAASTGARVVRDWAVRELGLRGRRLRNVPGHGWEGLTDRQRLVAVLAAQGLRNREIGTRLFVSERTVEGHIAAVLDALGAPSRVGIVRHLPGSPAPDRVVTDLLTPRQRGVAELVAAGQSNAAIAVTLGISEKTVEKHIADLFVRLKVQSRSGIAALVRTG